MQLICKQKFAAAHQLPNYPGDCAKLHGHTWGVEVRIEGDIQENGMVIDFRDVKQALKTFLPDHEYLNDWLPNPTAENLAQYLYSKLWIKFPTLKSVTIWESEDAGVVYEG